MSRRQPSSQKAVSARADATRAVVDVLVEFTEDERAMILGAAHALLATAPKSPAPAKVLLVQPGRPGSR